MANAMVAAVREAIPWVQMFKGVAAEQRISKKELNEAERHMRGEILEESNS